MPLKDLVQSNAVHEATQADPEQDAGMKRQDTTGSAGHVKTPAIRSAQEPGQRADHGGSAFRGA
jgi:hypothetical protein